MSFRKPQLGGWSSCRLGSCGLRSLLRLDHALLGRSPTWTGKPIRNPGGSLNTAGSLSPNPHATSDGCAGGRSAISPSLAYQFLERTLVSSPGNLRRSRPALRKASGRCGLAGSGRLQLALWAGLHLSARSRAPVSAFAGPSERARIRTPESAPLRSLLNVKAATLRHASKSPIQTAPAGRPATP